MNRQKVIEYLKKKALDKINAFDNNGLVKEPYHQVPIIQDHEEWVLYLYKNILKMDVDRTDDGFKYWMEQLGKGVQRPDIERYFRQVAFNENRKNQVDKVDFETFLNKEDKGRVLLCCKEGPQDIYICTSLFKSIKNRYPDWKLYVATKAEYREIIEGNPFVDKWLEWNPIMENLTWAEGNSKHNGFFNVCYIPTVGTQDKLDFMHNGMDKIDYILK